MASDVLVIGYGNPLRGDDGVGPVIAEELSKRFRGRDSQVKIVACHQLNPELAEPIAETRAVIFIDASSDLKPGEVLVKALTPDRFSPAAFAHSMKPSALLATASELFGQAPPAKFVGIGVSSFDACTHLSPEVCRVVSSAVAAVEKEIARCLRSH